jgi:hypothetical protein
MVDVIVLVEDLVWIRAIGDSNQPVDADTIR